MRIVKWAGAKEKRRHELADMLGREGVYVEPFLGSGSIYLELRRRGAVEPAQAVLGDACARLVATYRAVIRDPRAVAQQLRLLPSDLEGAQRAARALGCLYVQRKGVLEENAWEGFYELQRARLNLWQPGPWETASPEHAALLLWLNRACVNGLWRVNKAGEFNVSAGDRLSGLPDEETLVAFALALRGSLLLAGDYRTTLQVGMALAAGRGGRCYVDPPYIDVYDAYTSARFKQDEQEQLPKELAKLAGASFRVIVSNAWDDHLGKVYQEAGFEVREVAGSTSISRSASSRGQTRELLALAG